MNRTLGVERQYERRGVLEEFVLLCWTYMEVQLLSVLSPCENLPILHAALMCRASFMANKQG